MYALSSTVSKCMGRWNNLLGIAACLPASLLALSSQLWVLDLPLFEGSLNAVLHWYHELNDLALVDHTTASGWRGVVVISRAKRSCLSSSTVMFHSWSEAKGLGVSLGMAFLLPPPSMTKLAWSSAVGVPLLSCRRPSSTRLVFSGPGHGAICTVPRRVHVAQTDWLQWQLQGVPKEAHFREALWEPQPVWRISWLFHLSYLRWMRGSRSFSVATSLSCTAWTGITKSLLPRKLALVDPCHAFSELFHYGSPHLLVRQSCSIQPPQAFNGLLRQKQDFLPPWRKWCGRFSLFFWETGSMIWRAWSSFLPMMSTHPSFSTVWMYMLLFEGDTIHIALQCG